MITEDEAFQELGRLADEIYSCGSSEKIWQALYDAYLMGKEVGEDENRE